MRVGRAAKADRQFTPSFRQAAHGLDGVDQQRNQGLLQLPAIRRNAAVPFQELGLQLQAAHVQMVLDEHQALADDVVHVDQGHAGPAPLGKKSRFCTIPPQRRHSRSITER